MGTDTKIEWTDATWNPIIGCSRVSEGCRNCYAEGIAGRFGNGAPTVYSGLTQIVNGRAVWTGQIKETKKLLEPLSWKRVLEDCEMCGAGPNDTCMHGSRVSPGSSRWRPRRVFVNSMSDLFHENVSDELRDRIFAVMALCPQHTFQVLTKRPERMRNYLSERSLPQRIHEAVKLIMGYGNPKRPAINTHDLPLPNVWLGTSVENQKAADERIPLLLQTPASVRFLSVEPLLGPVRIPSEFMLLLDWCIVGGESGHGARPMHPDWARSLRDQCVATDTAFFFKQWGEWWPIGQMPDGWIDREENRGKLSKRTVLQIDGTQEFDFPLGAMTCFKVGKHTSSALLDGRQWRQFPAVRP